jgi:hypothetical protein
MTSWNVSGAVNASFWPSAVEFGIVAKDILLVEGKTAAAVEIGANARASLAGVGLRGNQNYFGRAFRFTALRSNVITLQQTLSMVRSSRIDARPPQCRKPLRVVGVAQSECVSHD